MAGADVKLHVDKLTADGWATWKYQVTLYLDANNLLDVVTGDEQRPDEGAAAQVAWDQREKKAKASIGLTVDKSLVYLIARLQTSAETWRALHAHFEKTNAASVYHLLSTLFELDMKEGMPAQAHLKAFTELIDKLEAVEINLQEPVKICTLLRSLPPSYAMLRTALQSKGADLTLEEVREAVLAEEQQRQSKKKGNQSLSESALRVGGRGGGAARGRGTGTRRQQPQFQGKCFNCGIIGHRSVDCRKPRRRKPMEAATPADASQYLFKLEEEMNNSAGVSITDQWIVDSGATSHMTSDAEWLQDLVTFDVAKVVRLGDGRKLSATGSGTVNMKIQSADADLGTINALLQNVLLVRDLACSLFSAAAAADNGKHVVFKRDSCVIQTENGKPIVTGRRVGSLYYLNCRSMKMTTDYSKRKDGPIPQKKEVAVAALDRPSFQLLHQRLGHVHEQRLAAMIQSGLVEGDTSGRLPPCKGCIEGKFTRAPFKMNPNREKTKQLLQLVHTDVCGQMPILSPGGCKALHADLCQRLVVLCQCLPLVKER